jgi:hypothetical protein
VITLATWAALRAVLGVDVLDDLFAAVGVKVHVDVGFLLPGGGQEPFERQVVQDAVDRGDPEHVTPRSWPPTRGPGTRSPATGRR